MVQLTGGPRKFAYTVWCL